MKLSSFSVILTFVILMIVGAALLPLVDVGTEPQNQRNNRLVIRCEWPQVSAKIVEQNLTTPIEGMVSALKGVERVSSRSSYGSSEIVVWTKEKVDVAALRFSVTSLLRQSYAKLPKGAGYPMVEGGEVTGGARMHQEQQLLLTYQVNGDMPPEMLKKLVSGNVVRRLQLLDGVERVEVAGTTDKYVEVGYDPMALAACGITSQDLQDGIRNFLGKDEVVGMMLHTTADNRKERIAFRLKTACDGKSLADVPIKVNGNRVVYLNDLARIHVKRYEPSGFYRVNGLNTVYVNVYAKPTARILHLSDQVQDEMEAVKGELHRLLYVHLSYDVAQLQREEMSKLIGRSLASLFILLLFVWVIYRNARYLMVVTSALAANILIAVIIYCACGIKLHIYSLAGITVSLGIIIDSVIVMADHYAYYHNRKAFLSMLAAMLTTIGSLVIVFFLPKELQTDLYDFALIIVINLVVALLVALFFVPAAMQRCKCQAPSVFSAKRRWVVCWNHFYRRYILMASRRKCIVYLVLVWAFGIPFQALPEDWKSVTTDKLASCFGGTIQLFADYLNEHEQTRKADEDKVLHIQGLMPVGGTAVQLNEKMIIVEELLKKYPEIKEFVTRIDGRQGEITVKFKKNVPAGFPYRLESKVIGKVITIGGADWSTYGVSERGFSNSINLQYRATKIKVSGYNYVRLYQVAESMADYLGKNPRVRDIAVETPGFENQEEELYMRYDKDRMSLYGVEAGDVHRKLGSLLQRVYVDSYRGMAHPADVYLAPEPLVPYDLWSMENSQMLVDSSQVLLSDVMMLQRREAKEVIPKENQEYVLNVAFNILGSYTYSAEYMDSVMAHFNRSMPIGFRCETAAYYNPIKEKSNYWLLLVVAVLIFFICSVVFESLWQAWVVVLMIPVSLMGAFLTFVLFDVGFGSGGFASLVLLSGLVVNASIYILCQYNLVVKLRKRDAVSAYLCAFNHKILPIFLTIVSTILGLLPFFWERDEEPFWFSFATGVTGGLLFSIPMLVFIMPLLMKMRMK